ncbi:ABC transporter ATP-binding protein [Micromonospora inyonensis]|uniref:NitT/TauT family transport system ATP-binding protein n=1 Tax=Micromonospora inyonensis TaxID=47866 RepID=A0A1C6SHT2_9ACTN|nr:ABC transporter ATP-binding protein [Micromonospora inyonensis]SCL29017.1 NitT/TauT family transport system ATP-binding protein [Micromonospora inyonensis]
MSTTAQQLPTNGEGAHTRPLISIRDLSKRYETKKGATVALDGIDLDIAEGEFVSVVGPSGCGKTTLLKILAGLEERTAGDALLGGASIAGPRNDIGIAFQGSVMLPWRRIIENVLLPVELNEKPTPAHRERAHALLALVGLGEFADSYPNELSGGMQQRAAICRALVHDPSLLLLDEPFGALDALTREQLNVQLNSVWEQSGKTALLITHSISEAVYLSQRVVVMSPRPGRIVDVIEVPFGRKRGAEILTDPKFGEVADKIRQHFNGERKNG